MDGWSDRLRRLEMEYRDDPIKRFTLYLKILLVVLLANVALLVVYVLGWL